MYFATSKSRTLTHVIDTRSRARRIILQLRRFKNPPIDKFYLAKKRRSRDFYVLKLLKVLSGCGTSYYAVFSIYLSTIPPRAICKI